MLKNYFKIAFRNLRKYKVDSSISIGGLALGLAACILLIMYVQFEWSYDDFHENRENIYRINKTYTNRDTDVATLSAVQSYPQSQALKEEFPEIETLINISGISAEVYKDGKYLEEQMLTVSPEFLTEFTFPLIYGNAETALNDNSNIVITEQAAIKYFGSINALGKTLILRIRSNTYNYVVSGIAKNVPLNSSIQFDYLLPFENQFLAAPPKMVRDSKESWYLGFLETWITLKKGSTPEALEAKFHDFLIRHIDEEWVTSNKIGLLLQPFSEIYFNEEVRGRTLSSNKTYSMILGGIAIVILIIAGINFMSLTLSRSTSRFHEIGIRKSVGALKPQIIGQILGEALFTCFAALVLGLILTEFFAPFANSLFGKEVELNLMSKPMLLAYVSVLLIVLTLITGLYPALAISAQKTTSLFASRSTTAKIPVLVRSLIVVQFGLTIALMAGTFIMRDQINFILNKDIGFNPDNVIAVEFNAEIENGLALAQLFSEEASKISGVQSAALTGAAYRKRDNHSLGMVDMISSTHLSQLGDMISSEAVDSWYLETMNINLIAGSNFEKNANSYPQDEIIINQAFADAMNWATPVGMIIEDKGEEGSWTGMFEGAKVIGVVENYHFNSLYDPLTPLALRHIEGSHDSPNTILVSISPENMSAILSNLEASWNNILNEEVFNYSFLDNMVEHQYAEEIRWKRVINAASIISILLSCFGLFGLSSLIAQKRTKEIGIRKVFGASINSILQLITKDFVLLIFVGFFIATPFVWYYGNQWLNNFSYKINLTITPFLAAGFSAITIALATVSWQAIKAATSNPVESLKSE